MSRFLLDTHFLYWWMRDDPALGDPARELIATMNIAVSVVSLWELTLKNRQGKLSLPDTSLTASLEDQGFSILPLRGEHVETARAIQLPHNDPFDCLLVAVAQCEAHTLLTRDREILAARLPHTRAA